MLPANSRYEDLFFQQLFSRLPPQPHPLTQETDESYLEYNFVFHPLFLVVPIPPAPSYSDVVLKKRYKEDFQSFFLQHFLF